EAFLRQGRIGIDHARVEAHAQDGGDALLVAFVQVLPLVVAVPGRRFADLFGHFVDGGVQISGASVHAGAQHRHVQEGRAHIDDDLRPRLANQGLGGLNVQRVERVGLQLSGHLQAALAQDAVDDALAFVDAAGRYGDLAELVVVLGTLVGDDLGNASRTDDQYVSLHLSHVLSGSGEAGQEVVKTKFADQLDLTIELAHGNGRHLESIEPVLLDHRVARSVCERQAVANGKRVVELVVSKYITRQTGLAAHYDLVLARTGR